MNNRLGCIDGRAATDRDDKIGVDVLERLNSGADARDRCMLSDLVEDAAVGVFGAEDGLYLFDNLRLQDAVCPVMMTGVTAIIIGSKAIRAIS